MSSGSHKHQHPVFCVYKPAAGKAWWVLTLLWVYGINKIQCSAHRILVHAPEDVRADFEHYLCLAAGGGLHYHTRPTGPCGRSLAPWSKVDFFSWAQISASSGHHHFIELLFSSTLAADVILPSFTLHKISWCNSDLSLKLFNPSEWSQGSLTDGQ